MFRLAAGLAAALVASPAAHAQFNKTVISNSGNGVNNTVIARNGPVRLGFAPQPQLYGQPGVAAPGGYDPGYPQPGYDAGYAPPVGYGGGVNRNVIRDSGNGIGNTIVARNGGGFGLGGGLFGGYGGGYGGGFPFGGGVNVNVITNSGNGAGNTVYGTNRNAGPGGININVITNSGNGIGNTIGAKNR